MKTEVQTFGSARISRAAFGVAAQAVDRSAEVPPNTSSPLQTSIKPAMIAGFYTLSIFEFDADLRPEPTFSGRKYLISLFFTSTELFPLPIRVHSREFVVSRKTYVDCTAIRDTISDPIDHDSRSERLVWGNILVA